MNTQIEVKTGIPARQIMMLHAGASQAVSAIEWLIAEGFEPIQITVDVERRCPVITIRTIGKCEWLKKVHRGASHSLQPGRFGRVTVFRAQVMGCNVEWTEGGH